MNSAVIFVRPSIGKHDQNERHINTLQEIARERGWIVAAIIIDEAGLDSRRSPAFEKLRARVSRGGIDVLLVSSLSHLAASVEGLVSFMVEMRAANVALATCEEGIDTTVDGSGFFATIGALDSYRTSLRVERQKIGRALAMKNGVRFGRPGVSDEKIRAVRLALEAGNGIRPTARATGVSAAKVHAIKVQEIGDGTLTGVSAG